MSRAAELHEQLLSFDSRRAGSDAERRAALWAAREIGADPRREASIETFWARPNWSGAQAWHVLAAIVGSLLASTEARAGAVIIFVAQLCLIADWLWGRSPGRLLTRERASQNVISESPDPRRVRLILTAHLDTGRLAPSRDGILPGWLFLIAGLTLWTLAVALARVDGARGTTVAVMQIIPTVGLIAGFCWLVLGAHPSDDAAGVAASLALLRILDAAPPAHLGVELALTGAGSGDGLGLRRYLRARRPQLTASTAVVLGLGAGGAPIYLLSDGPLLPTRFFAPLRNMAADGGLLAPARGRGCSPALRARLANLPALSIAGPPDTLVEAALELIDAIDADLGDARGAA